MRCPKTSKIFVSGNLIEEWFRAVGRLGKLSSLQFNYCKYEPDWFRYFIGCGNLLEVNLCRYEANDTVLIHLASCGSIQALIMERTWGVSARGLVAIAKGCNELRYITTTRIETPLDSAMKAFSKFCPKIEQISLNECSGFDDDCLYALVEAKSLQNLEVNYGGYSEEGVQMFQNARPNVDFEFEFSDW